MFNKLSKKDKKILFLIFFFFVIPSILTLIFGDLLRQIYYYYAAALILISLYYVTSALDRYATAKIRHVKPGDIGNKQALWIFKPLVFISPLIIVATSTPDMEEMRGLIFGIICAYSILFTIGFYKNRFYFPLSDRFHKEWAEKNNFSADKNKELTRNFNNTVFFVSYDRIGTGTLAGNVKIPEGDMDFPGKAFLFIRTANLIHHSFSLPPGKNELWEKIGPQYLEFIINNNIEMFATQKWFVARVQFETLKNIDIEKLLTAMTAILKEIKYRKEAGFSYKKY